MRLPKLALALVAAISLFTVSPVQAAQKGNGLVAVTQSYNIFLTWANGSHRFQVTAKGTGYGGIFYPSYSWSPDNRYLLIVKKNQDQRWGLYLMNNRGGYIRTLEIGRPLADFFPSWARDADQVAYVSWQRRTGSRIFNAVNRVDINGHKSYLFGYYGTGGCHGVTNDPSAFLFWHETGYGGTAPTLQWGLGFGIAIHNAGCAGQRLNVVDLKSRRVRPLNPSWSEAALSRLGRLAVSQHGSDGVQRIVLTYPWPRSRPRVVARGELPLWSADGKALYFVQRTQGTILKMTGPSGVINSPTFTTTIWQAWKDGSHLVSLWTSNAFGLGPMAATPDHRSLIFSRVDNLWNLWNHRLGGNRYTADLLRRYGPRVNVQRLLAGGALPTIAFNAGRPAVMR